MRFNIYFSIALLLIVVAGACKKDDAAPEAALFYEVSVDGDDVTFTNKTTGAVSYKWDFGDGTSSTEENPVHTYPGKGKYVPTLYATTKGGRTTEGSTVIHIAKSSPVKLDDNSLADWDTINKYEIAPVATETYFKKAKFDYDANYVYVYLEVVSKATNGDIYDFYIDSDNDASTGLNTGTFPGGGYDVLLEGPVLSGKFDNFIHTGGPDDFTFGDGATEFYTVGTKVQDGNTLKFEMRISRSKLKGMAATTGFKIGIEANKIDWTGFLGDMPGAGKSPIEILFE